LLSEQTQILGSPNILEWSERFKRQLHVEAGAAPTNAQMNIYNGQREYIVPIMNRGQTVKITLLNSGKTAEQPSIWLSVIEKGVKLRFNIPQAQILGVPQPRAAFVGVLIGIVVVIALISFVYDPWALAIVSLIYGLVAQIPGAYAIRLLRKVREAIDG